MNSALLLLEVTSLSMLQVLRLKRSSARMLFGLVGRSR
jgi:hypothetical protein